MFDLIYIKQNNNNNNNYNSNFRVYNIQQGKEIQIGAVLAGNLTLTSEPIYHDGTSVVSFQIKEEYTYTNKNRVYLKRDQ